MLCMCSKLGFPLRCGRFICHKMQQDQARFGSRYRGRANIAAEGSILRPVAHQAGQGGISFPECISSSRYQSRGVSSGLAIWEAPIQRHRSSRPGDVLLSLCEEGNLSAALDVLPSMDQRGTAPSVRMYRCLLKACARKKVLAQAKQVHAHLASHSLEFTRALGEYLVCALVKCGGLEDAVQVFDMLPHRSNFSWSVMISGYTAAGQGRLALRMYQCMREEGLEPDKHTFVSLLRACGSVRDLEEGKRMHIEAAKYGFGSDLYVGSSLVYMYGQCGSIVDAQTVFDALSQRNVVLWTVMVAAYAQQGQAEKALHLYAEMREEGTSPDVQTFLSAVQACGLLAEKEESVVMKGKSSKVKSLGIGKAIHADAHIKGYTSNVFVGNTLVSMYGRCGSILDSQTVFDGLSNRDVVSWTALLAAYVQHGLAEKALQLYEQMQNEGRSPNDVTFVSVLQACGLLAEKEETAVDGQFIKFKSLQRGKAVHAGLLMKTYTLHVPTGNSLVSMYAKCGSIVDAQNGFEWLSQRNVVSWTAILTAYAQQGQADKALQLYQQMKEESVSPDHITFVSVIQACGMLAEKEDNVVVIDRRSFKVKSLERCKAIHADVCRKGYDSNVVVGNTLVSIYGKCGSLADSWHAFNRLSYRDAVSWTAMVTAHAQQGQATKAIQLYTQMQEAGTSPNYVTLVCVLQACSHVGGLDMCRQIHRTLVSTGSDLKPLLATTLIHTYARCASMVDAQAVFDMLLEPDVVTWTALIAGYAREGKCATSLQYYEDMLVAGMKPNGVTFLSLLSACSHAGLVDKGVDYFQSMTRDYGLTPEVEHYVSMVDLLGRAGYFARVKDLLLTIPLQPTLSMWLCLLCACRKYGKVLLGRHAFQEAVSLEPRNPAAYLLMSNIYGNAGLWDSAHDVNVLEQRAGVWSKPAESWIENGQEVHCFVVEDREHPEGENMYELLQKVTSQLKVTLDCRVSERAS